jgi:Tfp pilus assembly protein PilN
MSVADNFDQIPDAWLRYVRAYYSQAARRQFQVSVVLIVVLAVAAFVLGILFRFKQPTET